MLHDEGYNLLHCLGCAVQVNHSLVDPHLVTVPGLGALSTGGLAAGDTEGLGGHADGTLHPQLRLLGPVDEVTAHCRGGEGGGEEG